MRQTHSKPFKNILISDYFNIYDTMRIPSHPLTTTRNLNDTPKKHRKSSSYFVHPTSRLSTEIKDSPLFPPKSPSIVPRIETQSFFHPAPKILDSKELQKRAFISLQPISDPKKEQQTKEFLSYLDFMHSRDEIKLMAHSKLKKHHLKNASLKSRKNSSEFNIYSNVIDRESVVKGLNDRLYYGNRATLIKNTLPAFLEDLIPQPPVQNFQRKKTLRVKTIKEGTIYDFDAPLNMILKGSNFYDHQLLLDDLLKAVLSLKKHMNEKTCIRLLIQLVGNCKKLLDSLIDYGKDSIQLYEPLTPRSFYLRLTDSSKTLSKLNSLRSFNTIPMEAQNSKINTKPWLDQLFVRQLLDFKIRLQDASISIQNEKYQTMKNSIIHEYESILEKELIRLQKGKNDGNRKKYEKVKKELKLRMEMGNFFTGSSVNIGLKNCEGNCGELVLVDKIEKAALEDLETAIFSLKCKQSDIIESIE